MLEPRGRHPLSRADTVHHTPVRLERESVLLGIGTRQNHIEENAIARLRASRDVAGLGDGKAAARSRGTQAVARAFALVFALFACANLFSLVPSGITHGHAALFWPVEWGAMQESVERA